jgi:uncharacterized protein (TIGR03067 family)
MVKAMFMTKLTVALASVLLLVIGVTSTEAGVPTHRALSATPIAATNQDAASAQAPKPQPNAKADKERIQGTWKPTSIEEGGRAFPAEELKARNFTWIFTGDMFTLTFTEKKNITRQGSFKLDPSPDPKALDLIDDDGTPDNRNDDDLLLAIYSLEGDTLKLCIHDHPTGERPTTFATKSSKHLMLFVLKREPRKEQKRKEAHDTQDNSLAVARASNDQDSGAAWTTRATLRGHKDEVVCLAFGVDELATASKDGTIKLWDISTGKEKRACTYASEAGLMDSWHLRRTENIC